MSGATPATPARFLLPADVFMALGLSAEAHGGIGPGPFASGCCAHAQAMWLLDTPDGSGYNAIREVLKTAGLDSVKHDQLLYKAGIYPEQLVPFERWCQLVGVDIAEGGDAS